MTKLFERCSIQDCLSAEGRPPANVCIYQLSHDVSCSCDLDLDHMTLIYEFDPDILKTYLHSANGISRQRLLKVRVRTRQTRRHTDRHDRTHYQPHSRVVNNSLHILVLNNSLHILESNKSGSVTRFSTICCKKKQCGFIFGPPCIYGVAEYKCWYKYFKATSQTRNHAGEIPKTSYYSNT